VTGQPLFAAAAFVALAVVLAVDFNVTELYREAHGSPTPQPPETGSRAERWLESAYGVLLARLDRAVRALSTRRFGRRAAYDRFTVTALANLGLTTQLAVLGACLVLGAPSAYFWFVLGCLAALALLHLRAEWRARTALAS